MTEAVSSSPSSYPPEPLPQSGNPRPAPADRPDARWPSDADFLTAIIETQNDVAAVELDPAAVMGMIVGRTRSLTGADGSVIELVEGNEMAYRAASGTLAAHVGLRLAVATSLSGRCATTGELLTCDDAEADPRVDRAACRRLGVRSMVLVPLSHGGQVVGVLKVVAARPQAFGERDVRGLRLMAGLLAAALSNAAEAEAKRRLLAERAEALTALREANGRFRGAFDAAAVGMALVDLSGRWVQVNPSLCRIVGYAEHELLATTFQAITHPDDLDADLALARQLADGDIPSYSLGKRYVRKDGRVVWVLLTGSLVRDAADRPLYFVAQVQDVTDAKRRERFEADQRAVLERIAHDRPLDEALRRLAEAVEWQADGAAWASVLLLNGGDIRQVGAGLPEALAQALQPRVYSFAAGLARRAADADGMIASADVAADPLWDGARDAATAHGVTACWATPITAGDGEALGLLAVYCRHDRPPGAMDRAVLESCAKLAAVAVEHHQMTRRLAHLVRHDPLTGLPNRLCFEDRLQQAVASARRSGRKVGVVALDVDRFKAVNDTLGHDAGDALLQQFAARLSGQLRGADTLARTGGDEFLLVLPDLAGPEGAVAVAEKLVGCLRGQPFAVNGRELVVTSSMGVALYPDDGQDSATLQKAADERLYRTKRRGRDGYTARQG